MIAARTDAQDTPQPVSQTEPSHSRSTACEGAAEEASALALGALSATLHQLGDLLAAATDEQYVQHPVGVIHSSLGAHIRHCLDHFEALCSAGESGRLNYDDRQRGTPVETSRTAGLEAIARLSAGLWRLGASQLDRAVRLTPMMLENGAAIEVQSSLGRELAFVLSHTIHHNALVAAMCRTLGIPAPERFGYAPATLAHLDAAACAPSPLSR